MLWSTRVATMSDPNVFVPQTPRGVEAVADLVDELVDRSPRAALARARANGYVSPEQVRGEGIDGRTQVFLLGCLLYETLAGERPFSDRDAILSADPRDLADPPYRLPSGLARSVARCLEKHPDRRYQSPAELACALRAIDLEPPRRIARMAA